MLYPIELRALPANFVIATAIATRNWLGSFNMLLVRGMCAKGLPVGEHIRGTFEGVFRPALIQSLKQ